MNNDIADSSNMNVRRFVAENSRAALRQVRETLGGDAIILANRSVDGGVEVLAAAPEAVDALTRRMTATTAEPRPRRPSRRRRPPTPTSSDFVRRRRSRSDAIDSPSLFGRRTQTETDGAGFADRRAAISTPRSAA